MLPVDAALRFHEAAPDLEETKCLAGEWVIVTRRQGDEVAAVLVPVGHEIMKSLHRALRRFARDAGTLRTRKPRRKAGDPAPGANDGPDTDGLRSAA